MSASKGLTGTVNAAATALGSYSFASNIQILDITDNGSYIKIYPSRLSGLTLNSGDMRYFVLDDDGKISDLILNDFTGDLYNFGIVTSVPAYSDSVTSSGGTYKYIIDGTSGSSSSSVIFSATTGPAQV